jgi:hypothetical protein
MNRAIALLIFSLFTAEVCVSQGPTTGTPPFGSFGGGPFDSINLGNLNVHFVVPILNKAGRGMPFSYNLSYDSSVWYPVGSVGSQNWTPVFNWGWMAQTAVHTGYVSYQTKQENCDTQGVNYWIYSGFVYTDPWGTSHGFCRADDLRPHRLHQQRSDHASCILDRWLFLDNFNVGGHPWRGKSVHHNDA